MVSQIEPDRYANTRLSVKNTEPEIQAALPYCCWRRVWRLFWLIPALLILLGILLAGGFFLRSDIYSFRPRLPKIMKLVEEQRAETPELPPFLQSCLAHEAGNDAHIARILFGDYGLNHTTNFRWAVRSTFWRWSLKWHLSVEERQLLYCHFISDLDGHLGIQHVAQKLYQKPLSALNDHELASLVVFSRSPTRFISDRAKLDEATDRLLDEMR